MLKNSDLFYHAVIRFCEGRDKILEKYDKTAQDYRKSRGSEMYKQVMDKAAQERDTSLSVLRTDCADSINTALQSMMDALDNRAILPPTPEQLAIIQALKMRDKVTEGELKQAAVAVAGNPLCISIVNELAEKNGFIGRYSGFAAQIPSDEARERVQYLARSAQKLLHGESEYRSNAAATDTKESVICRMGVFPLSVDDHGGRYQEAVVNTKVVNLFCEAVDGTETQGEGNA